MTAMELGTTKASYSRTNSSRKAQTKQMSQAKTKSTCQQNVKPVKTNHLST